MFSLGSQRTSFVDYEHKTKIALQHLMFAGWDPSYETLPYPPATGQYALYKKDDLIYHINHAMSMVSAVVGL